MFDFDQFSRKKLSIFGKIFFFSSNRKVCFEPMYFHRKYEKICKNVLPASVMTILFLSSVLGKCM